ncbi:MAG: adenylate/guanylate cyclase domain-containing protein, partial [Anaerolineae bacterium]
MRCPRCDTENPDQAKFCLNCGARLAAVCPRCQAPLPTQARFCTECGRQVATPSPSGAAAHDLLAQPLQRLVPQAYADRLLATRGQAVSERRLVTILFSDIKGSTAMAEALDPEDVMEIMNGAFEVLIDPVARHEGTLARLMGDAVLAFFGAPLSHEDDAERAVLSALEIVEGARQYAARLEAEWGIRGFDVRVGINTGLVVVGEVGTDLRVEYTAMGDAINLAARMEQHAPPGGILISHDTYRHVRGAFDVVPQQPLAVKGKAEPVQAYLVQRARPRAFHAMTRGVEGIETPMVGRENELSRLQDALHTVVEEGACQVVTVVGEAGVGKSRLLHEFDAWCEAQPARLTLFKGRVGQEMQNLPYALLRDLFSRGFEIRQSDPAAVARDKLVNGWAAGFEEAEPEAEGKAEMKAHIVGQVLGFDFTASPHVQAIGDDAQQLRDRALVYLGDYF